ncbi:hypothetical protein QJQ45_029777, partial [Haematococcus lacustris]
MDEGDLGAPESIHASGTRKSNGDEQARCTRKALRLDGVLQHPFIDGWTRYNCNPARCSNVGGSTPVTSASLRFASADEPERTKAFPYPLPMDGQQKALCSIPLPLLYPALLAFVGGAGAAGMVAGKALPVEPGNKQIASYALAAVGAAAAAAVSVKAKKKRDSAAVVALYNTIVELDDPAQLTAQDVEGVGRRFGLNMQRDDAEGLTKLYSQFLENVIPRGDQQLRGDEAPKVLAFKAALGLSDEEAAPVHIEVARRLFRQASKLGRGRRHWAGGYESKDRNTQFEQRKAFQRLLYVSQVVFGDQKSAFLLPWRRHFNITDAQASISTAQQPAAARRRAGCQSSQWLSSQRSSQWLSSSGRAARGCQCRVEQAVRAAPIQVQVQVFVARRDNARTIFRAFLEKQGGQLQADRQFLRSLREQQQAVKLMDDTAAELVKEAARTQVESQLERACTVIKATAKARDPAA